MGDKTGIEWTRGDDGTPGATWNPTTGCDQISAGCDNCYALTMAGRLKLMGQAKYQNDGDPRTSGPGFAITCHPEALDQPLRWKRPRRIFVNSMSDLFHEGVPDEFIAEVFGVMASAEQHTFQVLTKRPQRMARLLGGRADVTPDGWRGWWWDQVMPAEQRHRKGDPPHTWAEHMGTCQLLNVWLGTSIENDRYTFRANHLRATPAAVRFVSLEPLLGPLPSLDLTGISWAIVGAESGKGARPMDEGWVRDIRDRCAESGTALFVKQLSGGVHAVKNLDEFPVDLRVRQYPETVQAS